MDGAAELHATEPLEGLIEAVQLLSASVPGQLREVQEELGPRFRMLERARQWAEETVQSARRALAAVGEDESSRAAEARLEEAEEAQERLEDAFRYVQSALSRYKVAAAELERAPQRSFVAATVYLEERVSRARTYDALSLLSRSEGSGAKSFDSGEPTNELLAIKLPEGFEWVAVDAVEEEDFLRSADEFRESAPYDMIRVGIERLYGALLPLMRYTPEPGDDLLSARDRADGTVTTAEGYVHPQSLANLRLVYFGTSPMTAWRDEERTFHMVDGRHRLTVARNLGFSHVPVKVLGGAARREP